MHKLIALLAGLLMIALNSFAAVNVNTANEKELQMLTGIGPAKAKAIIDYRTKNGGFKAVDDLTKVPGIGPAVLGKMKSDVTLTGPTAAKAGEAAKQPPGLVAPAASPATVAKPMAPAATPAAASVPATPATPAPVKRAGAPAPTVAAVPAAQAEPVKPAAPATPAAASAPAAKTTSAPVPATAAPADKKASSKAKQDAEQDAKKPDAGAAKK
ncbi:Competence protein ComEA helix-hairpin-helix repeat protein [Candidatus Accumulibacter aalborgensis]|uniref:Competence protein ComEA helix-hairpin-helix repeat protein n=1 Tax=Candidatus Accumulibacter aalborgensis TaxID=1860102 RepID=A0A1A8XU17_9PROT|nr:helix-hairpin-helix domain-containing protein [Candidatus Accumulibacter aalborgensis]SBT08231.1 Competence protein ComEA helix-hairpin-helix repeat protein [Candidatus Accumulibacter aalborgensis]